VTIYAETSALLRWLLGAHDAALIAGVLSETETVFTSRLTTLEIERVLTRALELGKLGEAGATEARSLLARAEPQWRVIALVDDILERAARPFPIEPVRTLDAIHLATALFASRLDGALQVLTTDRRIGENARRLGLRVQASSR